MANGFKVYRHTGGGTVRLSGYTIATADTTSIWNGDLVNVAAGVVTQAATNEAQDGVFLGCSYTAADGSIKFSPYWPGVNDGKKNIQAIVCDDPNVELLVKDTATAALAVGDNCDLVDNGGEDSTIGASTMTVGDNVNSDFIVVKVLDNRMVVVKRV